MTIALDRARALLAFLLTLGGAGLVTAGALGPWASVTLFHNIAVSIPGPFFLSGNICLATGVLVLLGARRSPLLCLLGAVLALWQVTEARVQVPRLVRHQVIGAQMALFPWNSLLTQFHIREVQVSDYSVPDAALLGPGLQWTGWGGALLLAGAVFGLPSDPVFGWVIGRAVRVACRRCGARWPLARGAQFCPECGEPVVKGRRVCPHCRAEASGNDKHCIACGLLLPAA